VESCYSQGILRHIEENCLAEEMEIPDPPTTGDASSPSGYSLSRGMEPTEPGLWHVDTARYLMWISPVGNDITWRIMVIAMIIWGLDALIIDVETAFLCGNLEEEIYMDFPEGMEKMLAIVEVMLWASTSC